MLIVSELNGTNLASHKNLPKLEGYCPHCDSVSLIYTIAYEIAKAVAILECD